MTVAMVDDDSGAPKTDNGNALQVRVGHKSPPVHSRFKPGNPGGPGRPKLTEAERAARNETQSLREQLKSLAPRAIERLAELKESDNEFIAAKAAQFLAEKGIELEQAEDANRPTAARLTVDAGKIEEAQRLLTEGDDDGEDDKE